MIDLTRDFKRIAKKAFPEGTIGEALRRRIFIERMEDSLIIALNKDILGPVEEV